MKRLVLLFLIACSDPTRDHQIERLGEEDPAVPTGPLHRPGQPCVLCHSSGGPANSRSFAVGGTIYATNASTSAPAANIEVRFVDARSSGPFQSVFTNEAGNFFVDESDWDTTFPFRVGIYRDGKLLAEMGTTVNRDGSCATCHAKTDPGDSYAARQSIGPVYVKIEGEP